MTRVAAHSSTSNYAISLAHITSQSLYTRSETLHRRSAHQYTFMAVSQHESVYHSQCVHVTLTLCTTHKLAGCVKPKKTTSDELKEF